MTEVIRSLTLLFMSATFVGTLRSIPGAPGRASRVGRFSFAWITGTLVVAEVEHIRTPLSWVTFSLLFGAGVGVYFCYLTFHDQPRSEQQWGNKP